MTQVYELDDNDMVKQANQTLCVVVDGLRIEGFLTQEEADKIHTHYSIIIEGRSWLPNFLADWLKIDEGMRLRLVKAVNRTEGK